MKLYKTYRGIGFNDNAIVVISIPGNMGSLKFISHLKKIIEEDKGFIGMSLDTIITGVSGGIGFHKESDYKHYIKIAKKTWKEVLINRQYFNW